MWLALIPLTPLLFNGNRCAEAEVETNFMVKLQSFFFRFERTLLVLAASAGLTALLMNLNFNLFEANLYDLRMAKGAQPQGDSQIVLVTLDDKTTKALDELAPLPLDYHARFLEAIEHLEPKAVAYLVDFNQINQSKPDMFQSEWATRFMQAATRMENRGSVIMLGTNFDVTGEVLPPYPVSSLPHAIAVIHKDGNVFGQDRVTRRAMSYLNGKPTLHIDLAQRLGFVPYGTEPRGSYSIPAADAKYFFFRYHGNPTIKENAPLPYPHVSFIDVLQGNVDPAMIRGKILMVGTVSKDNATDFAYTPYTNEAFSDPKLSIHADILDSVIQDDSMVRAPTWLNGAMTFLLSSAVFWFVLTTTPLYGLFATFGFTFAFVILAQIAFQKGFWIRLSQPLVGIVVAYYIVVPYRLIREYKKRWDYQRKNELLTQVEELKTNFLNLVTHDLKTPVARIQGLAEVILRKSSEHLNLHDVQQLQHIIGSTEELNRFITSILELSKVESNHLHIRLESKDINQLIEKSVEGFKAQARSSQIKIVAKLEPLFPIKMDASLISKVINNLIDNAMKYSPANSEILIESRESGAFVEIAITDQGIGMTSEERENLFTRFYRAKNDTTAKVSGTGLGLYLTRYFIEAHQGRVEVISEKGQGSTFKIFLPMEQAEVQPQVSQVGLTKRLKSVLKKPVVAVASK
jgi:signal transduction histidine kinase